MEIKIRECKHKGKQCGKLGGCYVNGIECEELEKLKKNEKFI